MSEYTERPPLSKRGRIILSAIGWIVLLGPLMVGLTILLDWYVLFLLLPAAWATWDYIRRGGGAQEIEDFLHRSSIEEQVAKGHASWDDDHSR